ncbi:MAG: DUF5702 domain-containing protein [Lachnospiraceae bacterium]|nr:DUF5702 domain-containing protein [Lachnospiraceae bacterium]
MKKHKGSLTVFFALTIMMFVSLSFALTEVVHLKALTDKADVLSDIGIESTFSDYNRLLWEEYNLLAIDSGYCSSSPNTALIDARAMSVVSENSDPDINAVNLLRMSTVKCESKDYGMITDNDGAPLIKEAAIWSKSHIPAMLLTSLGNYSDRINNDKKEAGNIDKAIEDANNLSSEVTEKTENDEPLSEEEGKSLKPSLPPADPPDNPAEIIGNLKDQTLIKQVFGSDDHLSKKKITLEKKPSRRNLIKGTVTGEKVTATDKLLFAFYLKENLSNYQNDIAHKGLNYEWEYILMGNDSDKENIADVLSALLAVRTAENMLAILRDKAKTSEAEALATLIIGWTGIEALVKVLTVGIEAAWAYLESILDIRLLLSGGKISFFKSPEEWTSKLSLFANYFPPEIKAKECKNGLSYEDCLMLMTVISSSKNSGKNFMDILENEMHLTEDYRDSKIDNHLYALSMDFTFESTPLFFGLIPYSWGEYDLYEFNRKRELSYTVL